MSDMSDMEVVDVVGAAVGLRAYHRAMGQEGATQPLCTALCTTDF